ncbi:MAG TPA: ABC transporter substrate-binding protein [Rhizomicrobium sp.]|nr:ABC transporter substrate-binding protein [Rhizomicrobium sp.]
MRRFLLLSLVAFAAAFTTLQPVRAASAAETFVATNIDKGLQILGNKSLSQSQRASQFQSFLEGLTDIDRIAKFTLGNARRTASPADVSAFDAAFRNYAIAVYQSYFNKYAGQSLKVTGSTSVAANDDVVKTVLVDPSDRSGNPLEVDFRVKSDTGRPMVVDVSVGTANGGLISLAIEERDQFSAFLAQHNNSVPALVAHLNQLTEQYRNGGAQPRR